MMLTNKPIVLRVLTIPTASPVEHVDTVGRVGADDLNMYPTLPWYRMFANTVSTAMLKRVLTAEIGVRSATYTMLEKNDFFAPPVRVPAVKEKLCSRVWIRSHSLDATSFNHRSTVSLR